MASMDDLVRGLLAQALRDPEGRALMRELLGELLDERERGLADELLDVDGAAELLKMTPGALYAACARGQIPAVRKGRRLRFRRRDLLSTGANKR